MNTVKVEFLKLQRPANYVLFGLMLLTYIGISAIYFHNFITNSLTIEIDDLFDMVYGIEKQLITFFVFMFVVINIGKEYSENTLRKNIIDGYTREQFFTGKLLILLISVIFAFLLGKITILTGGMITGHFSDILHLLTPSLLINFFMKLLTTAIFAMFLVFLTQNIAVGIIVYFVWSIIENIARFVIGELLKVENINPYLPITLINSTITENKIIPFYTIIIATFYLFAMLFTSYYLLLKRDIK